MKKSVRMAVALLLAAAALQLGLMPSCDKEEPNRPAEPDGPAKKLTKEQQALLDVVDNAGDLPYVASFGLAEKKSTIEEKEVGGISQMDWNGHGKLVWKQKVVTKERVDYKENMREFVLLEPWSGVIWPGSLIQGKTVRGSSVPTAINIVSKRKKHEIIFGTGIGTAADGDPNLSIETEMKESAVVNAQNRLLANFFRQNGEIEGLVLGKNLYVKGSHTKVSIFLNWFKGAN